MDAPREHVTVERSDGVCRIVLDRPPVNVLDVAAMEELRGAVDEVAGDPDVGVVVLTGAGKAFCAGVDVADHTEERVEEMLDVFHGLVQEILELEIPVVAALNGPALGGGCELALAADVVLGRAGAALGQPEIRLGVFPPVAVALLPRLVGRQAALDLLLSGRTVEMTEAREMGLVSQVVPGDRFRDEVDAYVESLASLSRPVLRLTKRAVREVAGMPPARAIRRAEELYRHDLMELEDPHEGLRAFMEKRDPVWRNA